MYPHKVKGIQGTAAGGIRRMEGVRELLFKNLHTGRGIRRDIGIAAGNVGRRLIDIGEESVDGFTDRISSAEQSNHAAFRLWVFHHLAAAFL